MTENEIGKMVVDAAIHLHQNFGDGLMKNGITRTTNGNLEE